MPLQDKSDFEKAARYGVWRPMRYTGSGGLKYRMHCQFNEGVTGRCMVVSQWMEVNRR